MEVTFTEMEKTAGGAAVLGEDNGITSLVLYILSFKCLLDIPMEIPNRQVKESCGWGWMGHPSTHPPTYLPTNPTTHLLYLNP